jgi:hypothetical protein
MNYRLSYNMNLYVSILEYEQYCYVMSVFTLSTMM